jgi:hypothetical protein
MRGNNAHPLFIVCFILAVFGGGLASLTAIQKSNCDPPSSYQPDDPCTVSNEVMEEASIVLALSSLIFAIGAVGFQIGHLKSPAAPPPVPFPMAGGPPYPGPVPPPHQGPVPPQGPPPPPPVRG